MNPFAPFAPFSRTASARRYRAQRLPLLSTSITCMALLAACGSGGDADAASTQATDAHAQVQAAIDQARSTDTWTMCAPEGQICNFSGTRVMRYGAGQQYKYQLTTGPIACTNVELEDPAPGVLKQCDISVSQFTAVAPAPAAAVAPSPSPSPSPAPAASPPPAPAASPSPTPTPSPPAPAAAPGTLSGPAPLDVSSPTTVIGNGSASSCNEATLRAAVANGGVITFNCGSASTTIAITQPLVAPTDKDTTIDGADRIVLDGQGTSQILRAYRADFRTNDRVLAVQRLIMTRGRDVGTGYVARNGSSTCAWGYKDGGGGAIYSRDLNVRVWGVTFDANRGPDVGPDVAGGAIYVMGAKTLTVNNSSFKNNSAANGGAIGVLHANSEIHNTVFENNRATGELANFGNASGCPVFNHELQGGAGGLGGAFYSDGFNTNDLFSKVRMSDNAANNLGGAVFRSAYWGVLLDKNKQTITWENSSFERNRSPLGGGGAAYVNNSLFTLRGVTFDANDAGDGDGGALKITGATVQASDLTVTNNKAAWGGGIAHWLGGPEGVGSMTRISYGNNLPNNAVGAFPQ